MGLSEEPSLPPFLPLERRGIGEDQVNTALLLRFLALQEKVLLHTPEYV